MVLYYYAQGCTMIEETLLLEFTYYGRKTEKTERMRKEKSSSTPYPETTTESTFQTITEEEESDILQPIEILCKYLRHCILKTRYQTIRHLRKNRTVTRSKTTNVKSKCMCVK